MILKLEKDQVYLSEDVKVKNLKAGIDIYFPDPAWIETDVITFIEAENRLVVKAKAYHDQNPGFPGNQSQLEHIKKVKSITFKTGLNTSSLLRIKKKKTSGKDYSFRNRPMSDRPPIKEPIVEEKSSPQRINKLLNIDWDDMEMRNGGVSFKVEINKLQKPAFIPNPFVKEEFNSIKKYFQKALDIDFVKVEIEAEIYYGQVKIIGATSNDISQIDPSIIQLIKIPIVKDSLSGNQDRGEQKEFLDAEDFFNQTINQDLQLSDLFDDEKDLLEALIDTFQPKHHRNLKWLSENHNYQKTSLKFYTKPFSFLFFLTLDRKPVVIWETLDTEEATYIWTFEEKDMIDITAILNYCKNEIEYIHQNNKMTYISLKKENFRRIRHDYSDLDMGFEKWLSELTK